MKRLIAIALAVSAGVTAIAGASSAQAAQGCGAGFHRGPAGRCRPNGGPVVRDRLIVGRHYDRGYWDGRRYWRERYRHQNGWRYR
ncbi:hypothetical protein Q4F19_19545 [Sphingomonas sp. BIUV-7]|uniref:Uncharacterized protein n=1 Tax=Sphingomonas natans TaxID=3063330 RepID=A0ABT8YE05_9SPHN|nr:hypothetical protein [Sphingomonas sp. BIUV-7]MDO6416587.1 hypothetical protein [Sphingomonas sp. BIUV-7]